MKLLKTLILLLCISSISNAFCQPVVKVKKKAKEIDFLPNIEGVYNGEIDVVLMCSENGIENNLGYRVFSFKIQYLKNGIGVQERIRGGQIPDSICSQLSTFNINQQVFFTEIKALNNKGQLLTLDNLSLTPVIKEDE